MDQAPVFDSKFFDLFPPFNDSGVTPEVGVGGCNVSNTLMVAFIVVIIDEVTDLVSKVTR